MCLLGWLGRKLGENDGHLLHCFEPLSGGKSEGESLQELISERQRGSGPWQVCFGSQTSCHPVCSEGHLSQLEKGHCARGHSVAFTPDRALGGAATGSRRMAVSRAAGLWPSGRSKMQ